MDETTALYRHFSADGKLLYVGISLSPIARLCEHRYGSSWYDQIALVEITRYATRGLAAEAEATAIRSEHPRFNIAGTKNSPRPPAVLRRSQRGGNRLTAETMANATRPGYYCDGGGLYLLVADTGARCWVFRYTIAGRKREMGLGSYRYVSLAEARDMALARGREVFDGIDPIEKRRAA